MHQVELPLRSIEGAGTLLLGHSFEIAERLEECDFQATVPDHPPDFGRSAVVSKKVILEYFHAVEAGRGDGRKLLAEVTADRYGGDRGPQGLGTPIPPQAGRRSREPAVSAALLPLLVSAESPVSSPTHPPRGDANLRARLSVELGASVNRAGSQLRVDFINMTLAVEIRQEVMPLAKARSQT